MNFRTAGSLALILVSGACRNGQQPDSAGDAIGPAAANAIPVPVVDVEPANLFAEQNHAHLRAQVLLPEAESRWWAIIPGGAIALVAPEFKANGSGHVQAPWSLVWTTGRFPSWRDLYLDRYPDRSELEGTGFDFQIETHTVSIDSESAVAIAHAWRSVVRRARHPAPVFVDGAEVVTGRLDGVTYHFRADEFYGTTWSPESGPAADLAALAVDLAATVRTNPADLDARLHDLGARARALSERVEALPW